MPPSPNPYLNRSMIRSVGEFYGRRRETRRILSRIGAPTPQSVSLVGERRMGKSSLLWHLAQPEVHGTALEDPGRYLFVLLDFQGHQHLDQSACCALLARRVAEQAGERLGRMVSDDDGLDELLAIAAAVDAARMRLVFLFDEFETVTRNVAIGPQFFGTLRSLANVHAVAFVIASRRPLQSLCHSQEISESPFFNIFAEVHLGPMRADEIHELITIPSAAAGMPLAPHETRIRDLGGNLPFFVQIAASAMVECLADGREPDAQRLESAFLEEAASHFRYLWDCFDDDERACLGDLARGGTVSGDTAKRLEAQGFLLRRQDGLQPFSTALMHFVEQPGNTDTAPPVLTAAVRDRSYLHIGAGLLAAALAGLALWLMWPAEPAPGLQVTTLSPARVSALGLSVEVQLQVRDGGSWKHHVVSVNQQQQEAVEDVRLGPGDRLRLALTSRQQSLVYAFVITPEGRVERLPADATRPVTVEPGKIILLPAGDSWFEVRASSTSDIAWDVVIVSANERQGDLEDLLLRHRQAAGARQEALTRSLVAEIRSRGAVSVRFSVAPEGNR